MFLKVPTLSSWTCMDSKEKEEHDLEAIQNTWWFFAIGYISEPYVIPYKYVHDAIWPLYVVTTVHIEGDFAKSYLLLNKIGSFQIMCPVLRCLGHKGLMVEYYRCLSKGVGWGWTWWCLYVDDKIDWIIRHKDGQYVITLHNQWVVF